MGNIPQLNCLTISLLLKNKIKNYSMMMKRNLSLIIYSKSMAELKHTLCQLV